MAEREQFGPSQFAPRERRVPRFTYDIFGYRQPIKVTPPRQGLLGSMNTTLALDTLMGQTLLNFDGEGRYEDEPGYIPANDPQVQGYEHIVERWAGSRSRAQTRRILDRYDRNILLREQLERDGVFWTRLLGNFLDPINLLPVPFLGGVGLVRGMGRGALYVSGPASAAELARAELDPTTTGAELVANIGTMTIFGTAMGGVLGRFLPRRFHLAEAQKQWADEYDSAVRKTDVRPNRMTDPEEDIDVDDLFPPGSRNRPPEQVPPSRGDNVVPLRKAREPAPEEGTVRTVDDQVQPVEPRIDEADDVPVVKGPGERPPEPPTFREPDPRDIDEFGGEGPSASPYHAAGRRQRAQLAENVRVSKQAVEANRAEIERLSAQARAERVASTRTQSSRWRTRYLNRAQVLENEAADLKRRNEELEAAIAADSQALADPRVRDVDTSRLASTGLGLEKLHWSNWPFYFLKNNRFTGDLGAEIARAAEDLLSVPGIRTVGNRAGVATNAASAESGRVQRIAAARLVTRAALDDYMSYISEHLNRTPGPRFLVQATERLRTGALARAAERVSDRFGRPVRLAPEGPTFEEYDRLIAEALNHGDSLDHIPEMDDTLKSTVLKSARRYRNHYREYETELRELGLLGDQRGIQKRIDNETVVLNNLTAERDRLDRYAKFADNAPDEQIDQDIMRARRELGEEGVSVSASERSLYRQVLGDQLRTEVEQMEFQVERSKARLEELNGAKEQAPPKTEFDAPRYFRRDKLEADPDGAIEDLMAVLRENPYIERKGKRIRLSTEQGALRERAERVYDHILRRARYTDEGVYAFDETVRDLERQLLLVETELRKHEALPDLDPTPPHFKSDQGRVRDDGTYMPAYVEYHADGTITVHVDRAELTRRFEAGEVQDWVKDRFDSPETFVRFVEEHELAHTRLPQGELETKFEYETRINEEALNTLESGRRSDLTAEGLRRRREQLRTELEAAKLRGPFTPGRFLKRQLQVPNKRLIRWIEESAETQLLRYAEQVGPVAELATRYGDFQMTEYIGSIRLRMNAEITAARALGDEKLAARLTKEAEDVERNLLDVRDQVLGMYAVPDPDSISVRAARFASNFMVLNLMGKAGVASIVDPGRIMLGAGVMRSFQGVWRASTLRTAPFKAGADEVRKAGLAMNVATSDRAQAMLGTNLDYAGRSMAERLASRGANAMFMVNGLSPLTDLYQKFAGALLIDQLLVRSQKLVRGTASELEIQEMARMGIDRRWAERLVAQWERAGSSQVDGMLVANSDMWADLEAARYFRSILFNELSSWIITPRLADKPKFLHNPTWAMVFQFKSFMLAATQRVLMHATQRRDATMWGGIFGMLGLAMLVEQIRTPDWVEDDFPTFFWRAVENSAVLGIFTDVNQMLEGASAGQLGIRALAGLEHIDRNMTWADQVGAIGGPTANLTAGLAYAFLDPAATSDDVARAIRYMIPFNNLIYYDDQVRSLQRDLAEALE